nr:non-canonical purine NTP pyrophosphatase [uncultured Pseudodesulfovibrio sp.]
MGFTIYFGTSSNVKLDQYTVIGSDYGIKVEQGVVVSSAMLEPQLDSSLPDGLSTIVTHPLKLSSRFVARKSQIPYMVEDTMMVVDYFSNNNSQGQLGLPGPDTKNWWLNLGAEGLLHLLSGETRRSAKFYCQIGIYCGPGIYITDEFVVNGEISKCVRFSSAAIDDFPRSNPHYFHSIFIPEGSDMTLGEMPSAIFEKYDYRRKCFKSVISKMKSTIAPNSYQLKLF